MRLRKKPHTLEKLENFSDFVTVEKIDSSRAGNWQKIFGNENPLHVELGLERARAILFVQWLKKIRK